MSRVPEFTLYGDGRALVLPPEADEPTGGGLNPARPAARPRSPPCARPG